jgi:hypothetical protein
MQSFFSVDEEVLKLSPKTTIDSPTTVTHSYSPVDMVSQLEFYVRENFVKMTELGHLLLKRYPSLSNTIETNYLEKLNRAEVKINGFLADMNHHNQWLRLHEHFRDAHRHYILEFLGRSDKEIQQNMYILTYSNHMIVQFLEKNAESLNQTEKDILNQPYEFRVWLFNVIKREIESKASPAAGYENAQLKEYLARPLDAALGMREHYRVLLSSKIKKASTDAQKYQKYTQELLAKQLVDFARFRVIVFECLKAKYESLSTLQFEFALYREEVLKSATLSEELSEQVKFMHSYFDYNAKYDYVSPLENTKLAPIVVAESEEEEEWFFADVSPHFSMMVMETAYDGTFIDNDIFAYFVARQLHEANPSRHKVHKEQHILQVAHSIKNEFSSFRIV